MALRADTRFRTPPRVHSRWLTGRCVALAATLCAICASRYDRSHQADSQSLPTSCLGPEGDGPSPLSFACGSADRIVDWTRSLEKDRRPMSDDLTPPAPSRLHQRSAVAVCALVGAVSALLSDPTPRTKGPLTGAEHDIYSDHAGVRMPEVRRAAGLRPLGDRLDYSHTTATTNGPLASARRPAAD